MGIAGGLIFIGALIAFVLVPRQATKAAVNVSAILEERPDSGRMVFERNRALSSIAAADSAVLAARQVIAVAPVQVIDTFPPEAIARRQRLSQDITTLNRLIERADNAPLPASYRALANSAPLANDPQVQPLLDQLSEIERERDAFGTVGGVDPVYVALTSRATSIGRSIQSLAESRRAVLRQEVAALRPPASPSRQRAQVDTARYQRQRAAAQQTYASATANLAQIRAANERIDRDQARARDLANVGAPPLAMLAAAVVLALVAGFATSLVLELKRPTIADSREAEHVTGVRVLAVIEPSEMIAERSRRQSDAQSPPLIDVISENYRRIYLHLVATEANIPIVTVAGDDAAIVGTVASNIAAAAAYEARSTLLVDVASSTSTIASIFRIHSTPGLSDVIAGKAGWSEATVLTTIGRDRSLDVLPSGNAAKMPDATAAERVRGDFARMERRYDLIVIAAPTAYLLRGEASIIPSPDVVLCARVARTKTSRLKESVESLRHLNLRIHGLVLWNSDTPVIEAHDETDRRPSERPFSQAGFAGAR